MDKTKLIELAAYYRLLLNNNTNHWKLRTSFMVIEAAIKELPEPKKKKSKVIQTSVKGDS